MSLLSQLLPNRHKKEYFLTVGVEEHHIRAAVAYISQNEIKILGFGESDFSEGENETEATDIAISMAEKNNPEKILVERVIFALPQVYLIGNDVKPEYLTKLKKISRELNLKPHGFIEYPQAISYFLEKEEGTPPTVLLLAISRKNLTATLIRVGKIQQNLVFDKTSTISSDFSSILPDFKSEILPSRIIIYDESEKLEDLREELLRFPWHKHSAFHHTPKIEILPSEKIIIALVEAAGSSFAMDKPTEYEPVNDLIDQQFEKESMTESNIKKEPESEINKDMVTSEVEEKKIGSDTQDGAFGFVTETLEDSSEIIENQKVEHERVKKVSFLSNIMKDLYGIKLSRLLPTSINIFSNIKMILPMGIALGLIMMGLIWLFLYYPRSTVRFYVIPFVSKENIEVIFTTIDSKSELSKNLILAKKISEEVSGSKYAATTGKIKIGEKAKGEITIYNKTLSSKTFPKGTILQNGSLKFSLDNEATIASASDTGEGLSFGKAVVPVSAVSIGPESNLVQSSLFSFKDFPEISYTAKNSTNFTGGSSREIASVSINDQEKLESSLTQDLISRAKQQIYQKLERGDKIIESSVVNNINSKKFNADIDSEAQELSLTMNISVGFITFRQSDLENLSQKTVSSAPSGYTLDSGRTSANILQTKPDKNGNINANVSLTYYFLPDLDIDSLKSNISGRKFDHVESYLKTTDKIAGVKIFSENSLPLITSRLPFSKNNIQIEISSF